MTVERDAYEYDVSKAAQGLEELKARFDALVEAQNRTADATEQVAASQEEAAGKIALMTEGLHLLREAAEVAFEKLYEFGKEAVALWHEQAQADRILERAAGDAAKALKEQAEVIEASLGYDAVKIEKMQTLLYTYGEAPGEIDKTIRAILDYSTFTGVDALAATEALTTSISSGKQAFKELGIHYETTGQKSADLVAATEALAKKLGGTSELDVNSLAGQTRRASSEWENLVKGLGRGIDYIAEKTQVVDFFRGALEKWNKMMSADDPIEVEEKRLAALEARRAQFQKVATEIDRMREARSKGELSYADMGLLPEYEKQAGAAAAQVRQLNIQIAESEGLLEHLKGIRSEGEKKFEGAKNPSDGPTSKKIQEEEQAKTEAAKKAAEARKEIQLLEYQTKANLRQLDEDDEKKTEDHLYSLVLKSGQANTEAEKKAQEDWLREMEAGANKAAAAEEKKQKDLFEVQMRWHLKQFEENKRQAEKLRDLELSYERERVSMVQGAVESMISAELNYVVEVVKQNTNAAKEIRRIEQEKKLAGLSAAEAEEKRLQLEKQLQDQQIAGFWKVLGEQLMSLGQQAAVKGVMAGADALAFLAVGNIPAATTAGLAAAAYGTIALGIGGAGAAITMNRGATTEEQAQIDSANESGKKGGASASASASSGGSSGTSKGGPTVVFNVTNFGVAGMTDIQQAAQLEKMRRAYLAQRTGAGG